MGEVEQIGGIGLRAGASAGSVRADAKGREGGGDGCSVVFLGWPASLPDDRVSALPRTATLYSRRIRRT